MSNIFEFLGLPADHRKGQKITQHVKHIDEVADSKKSWPMFGQVKKDGVYALVVKLQKKVAIFSRTGKLYTNTEKLVMDLKKYKHGKGMNMSVYIAELCCDECSLETLSGIVNPNRKKGLSAEQKAYKSKMYLSYHDAIPVEAFKSGYCKLPYENRYRWLMDHLPKAYDLIPVKVLVNEAASDKFFDDNIEDGEEGIVFKQFDKKMSDWKAGHKGYRTMKRVRGVDYDLLCIGAEEGKGKYKGLVANLIFEWKEGKQVKCMLGKGWTHEDAKRMWEAYTNQRYVTREYRPVGKIFQVYALQESSKGKLRLPKVGEMRFDKPEPDIKWEV